jgi:tagatose 1,6-diphosphate aldolase
VTTTLTDGEIALVLTRDTAEDAERGWARALRYDIARVDSGDVVGNVELRLGYTMNLVRYGGHIGYGVAERHRGHHYAAKACLLLRSVARDWGMDVLWITCNPDNWPSRKTCEWLGAALVEIVDLPEDNDQYERGDRQKCRYRWIVY